MSKNTLFFNNLPDCDRWREYFAHRTARANAGIPSLPSALPPSRLNDHNLPLDRLKTFPEAFHPRIDLLRKTQIHDEDMVLLVVYQPIEAGCQLCATLRRKSTLEDRQLQPSTITVHELEDLAPTPIVGDVIGHDIKPFLRHDVSLPRLIVDVGLELAVQIASEKPHLHFDQATQ